MADLVHNIEVAIGLEPVVLSATDTSDAVDRLGFDSLAVTIMTGAIAGSGNFTPKLEHSDDNAVWADVPASQLIGEIPEVLEANSAVVIGYLTTAPKRYVRAVLTKNSGTSIAAAVLYTKGHPHSMPVQ